MQVQGASNRVLSQKEQRQQSCNFFVRSITYCVQVGTYNVNGRRPPADLDLRPWLDMSKHTADVVAVGFQEVVPLNAGNVVMGMSTVS